MADFYLFEGNRKELCDTLLPGSYDILYKQPKKTVPVDSYVKALAVDINRLVIAETGPKPDESKKNSNIKNEEDRIKFSLSKTAHLWDEEKKQLKNKDKPLVYVQSDTKGSTIAEYYHQNHNMELIKSGHQQLLNSSPQEFSRGGLASR